MSSQADKGVTVRGGAFRPKCGYEFQKQIEAIQRLLRAMLETGARIRMNRKEAHGSVARTAPRRKVLGRVDK